MNAKRQRDVESAGEAVGPEQAAVVLGYLVGLAEDGSPLVTFPRNPIGQPVRALAAVDVSADQIGAQVTLTFVEGDPHRPVLCGVVRGGVGSRPAAAGRRRVTLDGETLTLSGDHQLVLRCGKASITLERDGRVVVRGTHLVSRSSGLNRIRGGAVEVN